MEVDFEELEALRWRRDFEELEALRLKRDFEELETLICCGQVGSRVLYEKEKEKEKHRLLFI